MFNYRIDSYSFFDNNSIDDIFRHKSAKNSLINESNIQQIIIHYYYLYYLYKSATGEQLFNEKQNKNCRAIKCWMKIDLFQSFVKRVFWRRVQTRIWHMKYEIKSSNFNSLINHCDTKVSFIRMSIKSNQIFAQKSKNISKE